MQGNTREEEGKTSERVGGHFPVDIPKKHKHAPSKYVYHSSVPLPAAVNDEGNGKLRGEACKMQTRRRGRKGANQQGSLQTLLQASSRSWLAALSSYDNSVATFPLLQDPVRGPPYRICAFDCARKQNSASHNVNTVLQPNGFYFRPLMLHSAGRLAL